MPVKRGAFRDAGGLVLLMEALRFLLKLPVVVVAVRILRVFVVGSVFGQIGHLATDDTREFAV